MALFVHMTPLVVSPGCESVPGFLILQDFANYLPAYYYIFENPNH